MAINVLWALAAVLLLTAQHCQTHDVQKVQGDNDNLLVHVISSMVKYAEKINDMEHKLSRQQENHNDELEKIANDINKIKNDDIEKIRNDYADDIKKIRNDHADDIAKMQKKHTEDIEMLKASLSTKQPITPVVGFHVSRTEKWSTPGKVPFDKVLSNYGNGWNSITHTFTAPTKGLYFLTLTVMNSARSAAYSWLMRGSTRVARAYADGGHSYNVGTVATVLMLDAGEHIYAQYEAGTLHSWSPAHYTYLAGFLIQKTN